MTHDPLKPIFDHIAGALAPKKQTDETRHAIREIARYVTNPDDPPPVSLDNRDLVMIAYMIGAMRCASVVGLIDLAEALSAIIKRIPYGSAFVVLQAVAEEGDAP